jgi:threonine dehydratase
VGAVESVTARPTAADVVAAAERIRPFVHRTPVLTCGAIDAVCGRPVLMKAEHLQKVGAYKARGATNQIRTLVESGAPVPGVVAASSGNHGQAVAWAAGLAGIPATIVVPETIARPKRAAIEGYGATVLVAEPENEARLAIARDLAARDGLVDVPPYDHPVTIAGQGTWVLEALDEAPDDLEAVVVPVGGGGLASGTTLGLEAAGRTVEVYGAEPAGADDTARSMRAGRVVAIEHPASIADALLSSQPGDLTFSIMHERLAGVITVTDGEIVAAMRLLWERAKQVVEPAGAASLAAVAQGTIPGSGPVMVVLSGGNVDLDTFRFPV